MRSRDDLIASLRKGREIDVLIVGGGINGVGVYRDLAAQGVPSLLVDREDFCAATSAAPSRLIHGGLRYLETGEFSLVRESVEERNLLLLNAPHMVKPQRVWIPLFSWFGGTLSAGARFLRLKRSPGAKGALPVKLGLSVYDRFGKRHQSMPNHRMLSRCEAHAGIAGLAGGVRSVAEFYDARITHPERLGMEIVADAEEDCPDAMAIPYMPVTGQNGDQVLLTDTLTGEEFSIRPRLVINVAGASIDVVNGRLGIEQRFCGGTKGSHVVLFSEALEAQLGGRMLYFETDDHRLCLIYRLGPNRFLLGTTDIPTDNPDDQVCSEQEIDYLFTTLQHILPGANLSRADIIFRFAGVRPLPLTNNTVPGAISRDHMIRELPASMQRPYPILVLVGGKWTTYRACAAEITDDVLKRLGVRRIVDTRILAIGGGRNWPRKKGRDGYLSDDAEKQLATEVVERSGLDEAHARLLVQRYGTRAFAVARAISAGADRPIAGASEYSLLELAYLIRTERVTRLADVVLRRTLLAFEGRLSPATLADIAGTAASVLDWSVERTSSELSDLQDVLRYRHGQDTKE